MRPAHLPLILLLSFALAAGLFAHSCGPAAGACGPQNCEGCCSADGRCELGNQISACGSFGSACALCGNLDSCTAAVCVPPYNPGGQDGGNTNDSGVVDGGADAGQDAGGDGGHDAGTDGGHDAGTDGGHDAGTVATPMTLGSLRELGTHGQHVVVAEAIVRDVSYETQGTLGDWRAEFSVVDPQNAKHGMWVEKFYTDLPGTYLPQPGDRIAIEGWYGTLHAKDDRKGYRAALRSSYFAGGTGKLTVTLKGSGTAPTAPTVSAGSFGNALGGTAKPNPDHAGVRVRIQGPLTLVNHSPAAMQRINSGVLSGYNGFEVSGGILVNNYKTFGAEKCDFGAIARDGGQVTFPNGISGVWDTYTHAQCVDGGTGTGCERGTGSVPGTGNDFTYALYPQDCFNDLPGVVQ